jgi:DNA polymerase V
MTAMFRIEIDSLTKSFAEKVDHRFLIRRLGICANNTEIDSGAFQLDMLTDYKSLEKEKALQRAMIEVRKRYGMNAIVKGMNLEEGATTIERNQQIGGHRAGSTALPPPPAGMDTG